LVVAYVLTFFCRSGEANGSSALATFLAKLTETDNPVLVRHDAADHIDQVDVCELASDNGSGVAAAGWLHLEFSVGIEHNASSVIAASPSGEDGTWGSDLVAELILSGETDWPLVKRIWVALAAQWSAIAWDEMSGFGITRRSRWAREALSHPSLVSARAPARSMAKASRRTSLNSNITEH
jgi:hypothetical protein